jgi:tetratricopeptide (TPR) repeat protein
MRIAPLIALLMLATACAHSQPPAPPATPAPATPQKVVSDPVNAKPWITLGNRYFDARQNQRAIEAYAKALQFDPNNPDVLTDQGVMYRELGAYDKALANFEKATTIDPRHLPSLLDLGILYAQDLKDHEKAIKTWTHLIQIAPTSIQAARAQAYIDQLRKQQPEVN